MDRRNRLSKQEQERLRYILHEIFVSKASREGPVSTEAFGEDDFLLNMSSRANAGEALTLEQEGRIHEIWKREISAGKP